MIKKPRNQLRYWLKLSIFALLCVLAAYYVALAYTMIKPSPSRVDGPTPAEWPASYEDVSIEMPDGAILEGWYVPPKNGKLVILLHGYGANRLQMAWHAQILVKEDFGVFLYDQRASGESTGKWRSWGWQDVDDLGVVLAYLAEKKDITSDRVSLVGASTGAEIAILARERYPELNKVIADGPGYSVAADLPPDRSFADRLITAPVGLVLGMMEIGSGVHPKSSMVQALKVIEPADLLLISTGEAEEKLIGDYYCSILGEGCQHWNVPNAVHTLAYQVESDQYINKMLTFLGED